MAKVTAGSIIGDILKMNPGTAPIFMNNGMHCLGCPASQAESIEEACAVHGMDAEKLVRELNEYLEKNLEKK